MNFVVIWRVKADSDWYQQEFRNFSGRKEVIREWRETWGLKEYEIEMFGVEEAQ